MEIKLQNVKQFYVICLIEQFYIHVEWEERSNETTQDPLLRESQENYGQLLTTSSPETFFIRINETA